MPCRFLDDFESCFERTNGSGTCTFHPRLVVVTGREFRCDLCFDGVDFIRHVGFNVCERWRRLYTEDVTGQTDRSVGVAARHRMGAYIPSKSDDTRIDALSKFNEFGKLICALARP